MPCTPSSPWDQTHTLPCRRTPRKSPRASFHTSPQLCNANPASVAMLVRYHFLSEKQPSGVDVWKRIICRPAAAGGGFWILLWILTSQRDTLVSDSGVSGEEALVSGDPVHLMFIQNLQAHYPGGKSDHINVWGWNPNAQMSDRHVAG